MTGSQLDQASLRAIRHYLVHAAGANAPGGQNAEEARRVIREAVRMIAITPAFRVQR